MNGLWAQAKLGILKRILNAPCAWKHVSFASMHLTSASSSPGSKTTTLMGSYSSKTLFAASEKTRAMSSSYLCKLCGVLLQPLIIPLPQVLPAFPCYHMTREITERDSPLSTTQRDAGMKRAGQTLKAA